MIDSIILYLQQNIVLIFVIVCLILIIFIQFFRHRKRISTIRKDTLKRSKAVREGQLTEQFAPYLPDFPGNPADAKFLGKPVDFICFNGLDEKDEVEEIVFVEVKTGDSKLSSRERSIKRAIIEGRIKYVEFKVK
ncbi:MAG: hypothetical protein MJ174_01275 [Treponema sp.]|nr:hypothetical protein [Treponema sp.]